MTDLTTIYNQAPEPIRTELLSKLGNPWYLLARREQLIPRHPGIHVIRKGRGWGKTRSAAEWIVDMAARNPGARMAIVGASEADAFHNMVMGDAGINPVSARFGKDMPTYDPNTGSLRWKNGSMAFVRGFDSTDKLSGFNHQFAWVDLSYTATSDDQISEVWSNLSAGSRIGVNPQILITAERSDNWLTKLADDKKSSGNPYWTFEDSP